MRNVADQMQKLVLTCAAIYLPTIFLLAGAMVLASNMNQPISIFLSDPVTVMDAPPFYGVLSNLGVLIWCVGGTIAGFSGVALRAMRQKPATAEFLGASGVLTLVLVADDLFLLHEAILPHYLSIPQPLVLGSYAVLGVGYLIRYWRVIGQTDWLLLGAAFVGLGLSVLFDTVLKPLELGSQSLLEDGFKLLGIVSWTAYFWRVGLETTLASRATDAAASSKNAQTSMSTAA